jgi:hypothetical protein
MITSQGIFRASAEGSFKALAEKLAVAQAHLPKSDLDESPKEVTRPD